MLMHGIAEALYEANPLIIELNKSLEETKRVSEEVAQGIERIRAGKLKEALSLSGGESTNAVQAMLKDTQLQADQTAHRIQNLRDRIQDLGGSNDKEYAEDRQQMGVLIASFEEHGLWLC